ncbi:MAG: thiopurine S-methyltransferase [Gammaproteobacteria bacterium]|nr:thiopurine S-methyltransferase [Gammaproteobacteria bacterium]
MKLDFWKQRWSENQIGFHLNQVNPYLVHHWLDLGIDKGSLVFVPLCGKSLDLVWLARQGHDVLGVECSSLAVESFFSEQKLDFQQAEYKNFKVFNAGNIDILQGDFFDLSKDLMADVNAVYDRASLVALPLDLRKRYVEKLAEVLPVNTHILLVALEYNQQLMQGPPFSVSEQEVAALYESHFEIEKIQQQDILSEQERFREKGLDSLIESIYKIRKL